MNIPFLNPLDPFPPTCKALTAKEGANGLLAARADLSPTRLIQAYRQGIFPWYSENQPILWWSPNPRMVLYLNKFKISHSLKKVLIKIQKGNSGWHFSLNNAFEQVITNCSEPRKKHIGTWISSEIKESYCLLHQLNMAHSVESWFNGELVGGLYCVAMGKMVYGESMFSKKNDASKLALAHLVHHLYAQGVKIIDCQQNTAHLASLGAFEIGRAHFENLLNEGVHSANLNWSSRELTLDYGQT